MVKMACREKTSIQSIKAQAQSRNVVYDHVDKTSQRSKYMLQTKIIDAAMALKYMLQTKFIDAAMALK